MDAVNTAQATNGAIQAMRNPRLEPNGRELSIRLIQELLPLLIKLQALMRRWRVRVVTLQFKQIVFRQKIILSLTWQNWQNLKVMTLHNLLKTQIQFCRAFTRGRKISDPGASQKYAGLNSLSTKLFANSF